MAEERFYIIGKLGGSDGFGVYDLRSNTSCNNQIDKSILDIFHNYNNKEIKELFSIKRTKNINRVYYTYIRFDLTGDRNGCMLGFTYVYENSNNVIDDLLTLRKRLKEALSKLINNNKIIINSFNDPIVQNCYKEIANFTNNVKATQIKFANSNSGIKQDSYSDVDDEILQAYISNYCTIEISENYLSAKQKLQQIEKDYNSTKQKLQETESQLKELINLHEREKHKHPHQIEKQDPPKIIYQKDKKQPFFKEHLFPIISIVLQLIIIVLFFFKSNTEVPTTDLSTQTPTEESQEIENTNNVSSEDFKVYYDWLYKNKYDKSSNEISKFTSELKNKSQDLESLTDEEKVKIHKELHPDLY
ncbi:MAG: hypothetical protein U0L65_04780 [Bacteroidales bacterium]|nr:hypothetical protein [Bacteroidales bacterium]